MTYNYFILDILYLVDPCLSGIQASRISIQLAKTSQKIRHFYKVI
jgi:hypothetical protein